VRSRSVAGEKQRHLPASVDAREGCAVVDRAAQVGVIDEDRVAGIVGPSSRCEAGEAGEAVVAERVLDVGVQHRAPGGGIVAR
jgi:hypothetical protein